MLTYLDDIARGLGYLLLAVIAASATVLTVLAITHPMRERRDMRRFHATARQAAGVDQPLADTDLSDLDGELRRLIEGAGQ